MLSRKSTVKAIEMRHIFQTNVCIHAQEMYMQSYGEIVELLHQLWAIYESPSISNRDYYLYLFVPAIQLAAQ
jgi:hypothetical protein